MVYDRTIYLADTDAAGVVYFASLLSICHEAYEASLEAAGISLKTFLSDASAIPLVHAEMDFFRPLYCGDRIRIVLEARQLSENEFEIEYRVTGLSEAEKPSARGKTRHVCIHPQQRLRTPLPAAVVTWLHLKNC